MISVSPDQVVETKYRKFIENEGMPILKDTEPVSREGKRFGLDKRSIEKGNLVVKFSIDFPKYIPENHKQALKLLVS